MHLNVCKRTLNLGTFSTWAFIHFNTVVRINYYSAEINKWTLKTIDMQKCSEEYSMHEAWDRLREGYKPCLVFTAIQGSIEENFAHFLSQWQ